MILLTREQAKKIDQLAIEQLGIPGAVLMENAGRATAELLLQLGCAGSVIICCGKGNNGGDGFVIARYLESHLIPVEILLFAQPEELSPTAKLNYDILQRLGLPVQICPQPDIAELKLKLKKAKWIVDALFGTGLEGEVRAPFAEIIQAINSSSAKTIAVDIPSGLDCDTGTPLGCAVMAQYTTTFVASKKGFTNPEGMLYVGNLRVIDIGIPHRFILQSGIVEKTINMGDDLLDVAAGL